MIVPSLLEQQVKQQANKLNSELSMNMQLLKKQHVQQDLALKTINLVVLSRGALVGLEECITLQKRQSTVKCSLSSSTAYFVSLDDFETYLKPELTK